MKYRVGDKVKIDFRDVSTEAKKAVMTLNAERIAKIESFETINKNSYYILKHLRGLLWHEYQLLDYVEFIYEPINSRWEILDL